MAAPPFIVRKTYARLLKAGGYLTEEHEVPVGDRDPALKMIGGPPPDTVAVRFFDRVEAEVDDPVTGQRVVCDSEPLDADAGWTYFKGSIWTAAEVEDGTAKMPVLLRQLTLTRIAPGSRVIMTPDGEPRPFTGDDQLLVHG